MSTNPEYLVKIALVGSEISLLQTIVKKRKEDSTAVLPHYLVNTLPCEIFELLTESG